MNLVTIERLGSMRGHTVGGVLSSVMIVLVLLFASLGVTSAKAKIIPQGEFAPFADCPLGTPGLSACVVSRIESGEITIGKLAVPIVNEQTLQGGLISEEESGALEFVGAADGNTLSKASQTVPGGLRGIAKCNEMKSYLVQVTCEGSANGATGVKTRTELAGPASSILLNEENLFTEEGTGLSLPIKVKLENQFLGNGCYIGSNSHPITLHLIDGTTSPPPPYKPITGKRGKFFGVAEGNILLGYHNWLVDNTFPVPGATGCGSSSSLNAIIDSDLGLPSASGKNAITFNATIEQSSSEAVEVDG